MPEEKEPTLSVCMIVKDEEETLPICLRSIKDIADEIIIVDTGSKDKTVEVAKSFGAKVYSFEWINDFSAARNESLKHAIGDWILVLDADEYMQPEDARKLKNMLEETKENAFILPFLVIDESERGFTAADTHPLAGYKAPRLFRNHLGIKFNYSLHENIVDSLLEKSLEFSQAPIPVYHYGYSLQQKEEGRKMRNLICILEVAKNDPSSGNLFELGRTYQLFGFYDEAIFIIRKAIEKRCLDYSMEEKVKTKGWALYDMQCQLATIYYTKQEFKLALIEAVKADLMEERKREDVRPLLIMGFCLFGLQKIESARKAFEIVREVAARIDPLNPPGRDYPFDLGDRATFDLATIAIKTRNYKNALEYLGELQQKSYPKIPLLLKTILCYLESNEHSKVLEIFLENKELLEKTAKADNKQHSELFYWIGVSHYFLAHYPEAVSYLGKSLELDPNSAMAYLYLGHSHKKMKNKAEADGCYKKALEVQPEIFRIIKPFIEEE